MKLRILTSFNREASSLSICSLESIENLKGEGCSILVLGEADPRLDDLLNEAVALTEIACRDLCFLEPETLDLDVIESRLTLEVR